MRNLTRLALGLLAGVCLSTTPAVADEAIVPGTSFTDRITNPGFDTNYSGWILRIETGTPAVNHSEIEVYSKVFDIYQTLTNLPAGTYRVTADGFHRWGGNDSGDAYKSGKEVINTVLYAQTTLREKQVRFHSLYSEEFTASNDMLNGYVNSMASAREAFDAGRYLNNTIENVMVGDDGILTIGFKTLGANIDKSWTIWDNVTLTYMGEAGMAFYYETIEEFENTLNDFYYTYLSVPSGIIKEIEKVLAYKNELDGSTDKTKLQALIDSMTHVTNRATEASVYMEQLDNLTTRATGYHQLGYPGATDLKTVMGKTILLMQDNAVTDEGNFVFTPDLQQAEILLEAAIRKYRFTEPVENTANGIDFTWAMSTPNFTKEGGDTSQMADGLALNWVEKNTRTRPDVGYDCRVLTVAKKNCWNNWSSGGCDAMNVYQEFNDLPSGMYSFSLLTTNDGAEITDQRAYASSLAGTYDSPVAQYTYATDPNPEKVNFGTSAQWESLSTGKFPVGSDGKLRVGMHSTMYEGASSGWFCFTDCKLTYHGPLESGIYETALQKMIADAEKLKSSDMLTTTYDVLVKAIADAGNVDTSDDALAEAGMKALGEVIDTTHASVQLLVSFRNGNYSKAKTIASDPEGIYEERITELMSRVMLEQDRILAADTTTNRAFAGLSNTLEAYLSLVTSHQECVKYAENAFGETAELIHNVLTSLVSVVSEDENRIEEAKTVCMGLISFAKTYDLACEVANDEKYYEEARTKLQTVIDEQYALMETHYSRYAEAEKALSLEIKKTTLALVGVSDEDEKEVTSWIANPGIEQNGSWSVAPNGWTCSNSEGTNKRFTKDQTGDTYFECYGVDPALIEFDYYQTITHMPAGYYRMEARARNCQVAHANGAAVLYATSSRGEWSEPIYNHAILTGDTVLVDDNNQPVLDENGKMTYINVDLDTFDSYEVTDILVTSGTLTLGVKSAGVMSARWFGADDFKLYFVEAAIPDGVNTIGTDEKPLIVYSVNGYITVEGAEEFAITDIHGRPVAANTQLISGVYIVKAGSQTAKVIVK